MTKTRNLQTISVASRKVKKTKIVEGRIVEAIGDGVESYDMLKTGCREMRNYIDGERKEEDKGNMVKWIFSGSF